MVALAVCLVLQPRTGRAPRDLTLALLGSYRPILPRLAEPPGYASCVFEAPVAKAASCDGELPGLLRLGRWRCSPPPPPASSAARALAEARAHVFGAISPAEAPPSLLRRAALLDLLASADGRAGKRAEAWLIQALGTADALDRPGILSELGGAELASAERDGNAAALVRAIEHSQQALDDGAPGPVPRFNLALALSELGLSMAARKEWQRLLAEEPAGPWAEEARERLRQLPPDDGVRARDAAVARLDAAVGRGDLTLIATATTASPQLVREWIETDLLPRWATAELARDESEQARTLAALSEAASRIRVATADSLAADAVATIVAATGNNRDALATAHRELADGVASLYGGWKPETAAAHLASARQGFERVRSPFRLWARFYAALALNYRQQFAAAESAMTEILANPAAARYPTLRARALWVKGLAVARLDRPVESTADYRDAAAVFCRIGEEPNLAATQGLLAAGLANLGHDEKAWELTRSALARRDSIFQLLRLQAILLDATYHAQQQGLFRAGIHIADELVEVADREGGPQTRHDARMRRATLWVALGRLAAAQADFDAAAAALRALDSPDMRLDANASRSVEQARELMSSDPRRAVELLTGAIAGYRATGNLRQLPPAYGLRAQALLGRGERTSAAEVDLAARDLGEEARLLAVALFTSDAGPLRRDRLAVLESSFDQMVSFQAEVRHDPAAAFRFSEQQRHWALWEWSQRHGHDAASSVVVDPRATVSWTELQRLAGPDAAVVAYQLLQENVLIWASGPGGVAMKRVPIARSELERLLVALWAAAARRDAVASRLAGERLHALLVAPVEEQLRGATRLEVVPSKSLQDLPFGLLCDAATGRYLYQDHAFAIAPSATAYARLLRQAGRQPLRRLLAVAATAGAQPSLPRLGAAAAEAAAVAAPWPQGEAIVFHDLVELRRLLATADGFHFAGHALDRDGTLRLILHDDVAQGVEVGADDLLGKSGPRLRLVTLSGCETVDLARSGRVGSVSAGFVRSLLAAGVPTVVASFLPLEDEAARALFSDLHRRLAAGEDPAQALRAACAGAAAQGDRRRLLCGGLAVFGVSPSLAAEKNP